MSPEDGDPARGQRAYQVLVASSAEGLDRGADLWNSGRASSDESLQVRYRGARLGAGQRVFWKVRVWSGGAEGGEDSAVATFTMGLLAPSDWGAAKWITAAEACLDPADVAHPDGRAGAVTRPVGTDAGHVDPKVLAAARVPAASIVLRKTFAVRSGLRRAVLFSTGLAHCEASINGGAVSDAIMSPGWTDYRRTVLYDTTEVTSHLAAGENVIALLLGNGMYNVQYGGARYVKFVNTFGAQKAIALLRLEYADGGVEFVPTDESWGAALGPITFSNVFAGEDYDQRLERPEWAQAILAEPPGGALRGHDVSAPPIKAIVTLRPTSRRAVSEAVWIYDLGQNASVMPRMVASGPTGSSIRITPSELLGSDGRLDRASCVQDRGGPAYWQYTFDGRAAQRLFPKFFYHGCRYLEVELRPAGAGGALPTLASVEGVVVHSSAEAISTFECSDPLFNRIYGLVRWAQRSNMMSVMTDCPHRERLGWLEQLHLNGPSLRYNFRLEGLYRKELNDMVDAQEASGFVPNIAPEFFRAAARADTSSPFRNSPEWGSSIIIAPWQQYVFCGDRSLLEERYGAMCRYFEFLASESKGDLLSVGLGDWYDVGPKPAWGSQLTPPAFTASCIYLYDATILSDVARLLGRGDAAERFAAQAARTRGAINARFRDPVSRAYSLGFPEGRTSQCAMAMALFFRAADDADRPALLGSLVADIRAHGNGLTAGEVGYRFVLRALADAGRSDVIFDMNSNPARPGYAMQLAKGATALTEKWDGSVGAFGSQNHFMSGQINEWLFHDLAGIQPDVAVPGFKHVIIRPSPVGDIDAVSATHVGPYGPISVRWSREEAEFRLTVTLPPNTAGTVFMPDGSGGREVSAGTHTLACGI